MSAEAWGIYNGYAEEFWKTDDYTTPMEFASKEEAEGYLAESSGENTDETEGYVKRIR